MPFIAEAFRTVPVSPEAAFDRLADHPTWKEWMPRTFRPVDATTAGPLRVGSRPRMYIANLPMPNTLLVTVAERGKELTWTGGSGLLHASHRFLFEAAEGGQTRIHSLETWAGLLAPLLKPLVKRMAEKIGTEQLDALEKSLKAMSR